MPRLLSEIESGEKLRGRLLVPTYETVPTGTYRHVMDYHVRKAASLATGIVTYSGRWSHELQWPAKDGKLDKTQTQVTIQNNGCSTGTYLEQRDAIKMFIADKKFIQRIMKGDFLTKQSEYVFDNTGQLQAELNHRIVQYREKQIAVHLMFKPEEFGYSVPKIKDPLLVKGLNFSVELPKPDSKDQDPDYSDVAELFSELDTIMEEARKLISSEQE
jgi:hypothetical protein